MTQVILQIGADTTHVTWHGGQLPDAVLILPIGRRFFHHDPPTPGEMEEAIMEVEDVVMPLARQLPAGAALFTGDPAIRQMAELAGIRTAAGQPVTLPIETVERLFEQLSAVALGRPAASGGVPTGPAFAAALLILREFMHHLGFAQIIITP